MVKSNYMKTFINNKLIAYTRGWLTLKNYIQNIWADIIDNKEVIIILTLIWIILYEKFSFFILFSGILISILVVLFTDRFLLMGNYEHSFIIGIGTLIKYFIRLIIEIYLAGWSIIPTIISGNANTEFVQIETKLKDELLIDILANSITLTPGTISVNKKGSKLLVLSLEALEENQNPRELLPLNLEKILLDYEEKIDGKA